MGTYTFVIYAGAAGSSSFSNHVLTQRVIVTVDDPDDSLGVGDTNVLSETGTIPTISAVSDPAYNGMIGQQIVFAEQTEYNGAGSGAGFEALWTGIGGHNSTFAGTYWQTSHPDNPDYLEDHFQAGTNIGARTGGVNSPEIIPPSPPAMPCFTRGTLIKTQTGERPIEDLTKGDMVLTMDHGYQPIRWIGSSKRAATGDLAPILIRKGALGNDRDLRVSPQHRMLLQGWQAELMHGENEVLATAKSLINDHSVIRVEGGEVEYFHMLFDTHEIIWAEGAPSESFHPGEQGWKGLDEPTRNEILELFPELAEGDFAAYGPSARLSLKHKEGVLLSEYMVAPQA